MKSIVKIMLVVSLILSATNTFAQIKNTKKETVNINGNCRMCKTTIEKAGNVENVANVVWNKDTKTAILTFDEQKTSKEEILKRIASGGYDNDKYITHLMTCTQNYQLAASTTEGCSLNLRGIKL